jgi:serine protease Do
MNRKDATYGALVGVLATSIAFTGGEWALAKAGGAVNPAPVAPTTSAAPSSFADIVQRVAPAVVSIDVEGKAQAGAVMFSGPPGVSPFDGAPGQEEFETPFGDLRRFFFQQGPQTAPATPMRASGSGFFISPDGYILTNNHVVEGAQKITVRTTDERTLEAQVVGRDPETDLAVIKVEGHNQPFVSFEDRARPRVGDWVVAVGNPFNLGGTATAGIVSALSRPRVSGSGYVDYMQIDAPINHGNSGGPTFDLYGRVVGVNSAIFSPSGGSVGIGFDIPADVAARVSKQLIANGKVTRGFIGATVQDVTPDIAQSLGVSAHQGALVAEVTEGGPGQSAGLQSGDLILKVDGHPITSASDLTRQIAKVRPGDHIHLKVRHDGSIRQIEVKSGVRPSEQALAMNEAGDGDARTGGLGVLVAPNPGGGVKIQQVSPNSGAAEKGLRAGDVITRIDMRPANAPEDITAAVKAARNDHRKNVLLLVLHNGRRLFVPVELSAADG